MSRRRASKRLSLWGPCAAYAAVIFYLSSLRVVPGVGSDTIAHLVEYFVFGALLARAFAGGVAGVAGSSSLQAWVLATLYGMSDEFHQSFVPGRVPSGKDVIMDSLGAALGALSLVLVGGRLASLVGGAARDVEQMEETE